MARTLRTPHNDLILEISKETTPKGRKLLIELIDLLLKDLEEINNMFERGNK